ncbi:unnamed protein product [Clonostachys rosea]|uniref:RING-type domain-containing protein n=1 Tax=Bionectria ochroleuca TaxID=29856 RepID=A0ABY6US06_BIOOC|nr:unnamed protein product [Clonostachys rosea]
MDVEDIDPLSLQLILDLQLEELGILEGKNEATKDVSDSRLAIDLYKADLERLEVIVADQELSTTGEPPSLEAETKPDNERPAGSDHCAACMEAVPHNDLTSSPCEHHYCKGCMINLFESSIKEEALFPPRCCSKPVSFEANKKFLSEDLCFKFEMKAIENSTHDRTYCHGKACSTFIPPFLIDRDRATCPKCEAWNCTRCKGFYHSGHCPDDAETKEILNMAGTNQWQRCYSCHRVVELSTGCYHITCLCNAEFCYVCGSKWKTCECDQFDRHRLRGRVEDTVGRTVRGHVRHPHDAEMQAQVDQEMTHMIGFHVCGHPSWNVQEGYHLCELCGFALRDYVMGCDQCRVRACDRCRENRVTRLGAYHEALLT